MRKERQPECREHAAEKGSYGVDPLLDLSMADGYVSNFGSCRQNESGNDLYLYAGCARQGGATPLIRNQRASGTSKKNMGSHIH